MSKITPGTSSTSYHIYLSRSNQHQRGIRSILEYHFFCCCSDVPGTIFKYGCPQLGLYSRKFSYIQYDHAEGALVRFPEGKSFQLTALVTDLLPFSQPGRV